MFKFSETNSLELYIESNWLFINDGGGVGVNTTLSLPDPPTWNFVAITIQDCSDILTSNVTVYLNGTAKMSSSSLFMFMIDNDTPVIYLAGTSIISSGSFSGMGESDNVFNGVMQDAGIYSRILTQYELVMLAGGLTSLSDAAFLPQCLCFEDESADIADEQLCDDGSVRYYN